RAGYLPGPLGHVHPVRRTPDVSILVWSLVVAGFVVWGYFNSNAVQVAVLTCNLTALVWYALAMVCLFILRRRDPHMPRLYKVPSYPVLPALVLVMSMFAAAVYGWLNKPVVLWLTLILYGVGLAYYLIFARGRLISAAPEELAARARRPDAARTGPPLPGARGRPRAPATHLPRLYTSSPAVRRTLTEATNRSLEPLTPQDVRLAVSILTDPGKVTPKTRFVSVSLKEPGKDAVYRFAGTGPIRREAGAVLFD